MATRCTSVDQFIETFQRFCDESSFFVATHTTRPIGLETPFAIQLADRTPVLRGICVVLDAWATADNKYGRPGIRLGIRRLTPDSASTYTRLRDAALASSLGETTASSSVLAVGDTTNASIIAHASVLADDPDKSRPRTPSDDPMQMHTAITKEGPDGDELRRGAELGRAPIAKIALQPAPAPSSPPRLSVVGSPPQPPPRRTPPAMPAADPKQTPTAMRIVSPQTDAESWAARRPPATEPAPTPFTPKTMEQAGLTIPRHVHEKETVAQYEDKILVKGAADALAVVAEAAKPLTLVPKSKAGAPQPAATSPAAPPAAAPISPASTMVGPPPAPTAAVPRGGAIPSLTGASTSPASTQLPTNDGPGRPRRKPDAPAGPSASAAAPVAPIVREPTSALPMSIRAPASQIGGKTDRMLAAANAATSAEPVRLPIQPRKGKDADKADKAATPAAGKNDWAVGTNGSPTHFSVSVIPAMPPPAAPLDMSQVQSAEPTGEVPPPGIDGRVPGSEFILPANPLMNLSDDAIGGFIECTLFEDNSNFEKPFEDLVDPLTGVPVARVRGATLQPGMIRPTTIPPPTSSEPPVAFVPVDRYGRPTTIPPYMSQHGVPGTIPPAYAQTMPSSIGAGYPIPGAVPIQPPVSGVIPGVVPGGIPGAIPGIVPGGISGGIPSPHGIPNAVPVVAPPIPSAPHIAPPSAGPAPPPIPQRSTRSLRAAAAFTSSAEPVVKPKRGTSKWLLVALPTIAVIATTAVFVGPKLLDMLMDTAPSAPSQPVAQAPSTTPSGSAAAVQPPADTAKPADGTTDATDTAKPADGKPADGKPADGKPADGKPGKPSDTTDTAKPDAPVNTPTPPTPSEDDADPTETIGDTPVVGDGPCLMTVNTTPAGANVIVDGQGVGPSPLTVAGPCTRRKVDVTHARYKQETKWVNLVAEKPTSVDIRMQRPTHTINITTFPIGATILIGGRRAGTSPSIVQVMGYSNLTITIEKAGYKTVTQKVYSKDPQDKLFVRLSK